MKFIQNILVILTVLLFLYSPVNALPLKDTLVGAGFNNVVVKSVGSNVLVNCDLSDASSGAKIHKEVVFVLCSGALAYPKSSKVVLVSQVDGLSVTRFYAATSSLMSLLGGSLSADIFNKKHLKVDFKVDQPLDFSTAQASKPAAAAKGLQVLESFLASNDQVAKIERRSNTVKPGEKIYFYFKVANLKYKQGRGAPYETRLMIKKEGKVLKDFGLAKGYAEKNKAGLKDHFVAWYHSARWNLDLGKNISPGNYSGVVTYKDLNSGQEATIDYPFSVGTN